MMLLCIIYIKLSIPIGASLNMLYSSDKDGVSIMLTNIYVEICINGMSIMSSQKFLKGGGHEEIYSEFIV